MIDPLYGNQIRDMLTNPGSFQGTPGFKFALDQGTNAINASNSSTRGSGNVLAELMKYGTGLANQDYGAQLGRLTNLQGQAQNYDLGQGQNANQTQSIANQYALGQGQNANTAQNNRWNYELGRNRLQNDWLTGGAGRMPPGNWSGGSWGQDPGNGAGRWVNY